MSKNDGFVAKYWRACGDRAFSEGKLLDALECYDKSLAADPNNSELWDCKAQCFKQLGRTDEELDCYKKALDLNDQSTRAEEVQYVKSELPERDIRMLYFSSEQAIRDHIIVDINANLYDRVLVAAGWERFAKPFFQQACNLKEPYIVSWNKKHSFYWLCHETFIRRNQVGKRVIIVSNYPRETDPPRVTFWENSAAGAKQRTLIGMNDDSLRLCNKLDIIRRTAVYLVGAYTSSYIKSVFSSQACGKIGNLHFQVLVCASDPSLLDSERKQLEACKNQQECHRLLVELSEKLEADPNTPSVARNGAILMD
jgi:tetratricopeptide (TPR) repeat protein